LRTIDDVLLRLLTSSTGLRDWIPYKIISHETTGQVEGSISVKILKVGGKTSDKVVQAPEAVTADLRTIFLNAVQSVVDSGIASRGIIIVIDEFDRVADRSGLASLLKSVGEKVKFALVGVATNVSELVNEHESVSRQLTGGCIPVPPMDQNEIEGIFNRGEAILENAISFDRDARNYISTVSRGHPFLVHLICLTSAIVALRASQNFIKLEDAQSALSEIALKGTAPIQEALYKKAVGHSHTRETILKKFADISDEEIRTTPVYVDIASTLGIADQGIISVYMGQLASDRYGHVIERVRDRYYRFKDSLFKAYAASRPPLLTSTNADNDE